MSFPLHLVLSSTDVPVLLATSSNSGEDTPLGMASRDIDAAILRLATLEGRTGKRFNSRLEEIVHTLDVLASELKKAEEKADYLSTL